MDDYELKHDHHTISMLADHMVFNPKFRRKVLIGDIADETEIIICKIIKELGCELIRISVNEDHVHLFYRYPPKYSVSYIAHRVKGASSRYLRQKFPELKELVKKGSLWSASCYHGSVGNGWEAVEKYIENQNR